MLSLFLLRSSGSYWRKHLRQCLFFHQASESQSGSLWSFPETIVKARVIGGKTAATGVNFVPLGEIIADDLDARADDVAVLAAPQELYGNPVVVAAAIILQDGWPSVQVVDDRVDVAVVVEIPEGDAAAYARDHQCRAAFRGNFRKLAVALIMK